MSYATICLNCLGPLDRSGGLCSVCFAAAFGPFEDEDEPQPISGPSDGGDDSEGGAGEGAED
jgi:hypothetical protein